VVLWKLIIIVMAIVFVEHQGNRRIAAALETTIGMPHYLFGREYDATAHFHIYNEVVEDGKFVCLKSLNAAHLRPGYVCD
jgi:hypothetical protein